MGRTCRGSRKDRRESERARFMSFTYRMHLWQREPWLGEWRRNAISGAAKRKPGSWQAGSSVSRLVDRPFIRLDVMGLRSIGVPTIRTSVRPQTRPASTRRECGEGRVSKSRVGRSCQMDIHNQVARLGLERAPLARGARRGSGELLDLPCRVAPTERDDFNGQRKGASQHRHRFV